MFFHWPKVYGALTRWARGKNAETATKERTRISNLVDATFQAAQTQFPQLYTADTNKEPAYLARFEVWAPIFATLLSTQPTPSTRRLLLEEAVDRLACRIQQAGFVGDMGLGRKVRGYAEALNGRVQRYEKLLQKADIPGLTQALESHNVPRPAQTALWLQKELAEHFKTM